MTRRLPICLTLVACLLLAASPAALAETATYFRTGHYELHIDGQPAPGAKLYLAKGLPRLLVIAEGLERPYLLSAAKRKVNALGEAAMKPVDGDPDAFLVDEAATEGAEAAVKVQGRMLLFTAENKRLKVEPPQPLVAELSADEARLRLPEFRRYADAYSPKTGNVRLLGTLDKPVELLVFMGSWCPHCEKLVPRLARTLSDVGGDTIKARYRFLPRKMTDDPIARQYGVKAVPTVLVMVDGKVKTRLEGADLQQPDATLARILFGG